MLRTQHRHPRFYRVRESERQSVNDCSARDWSLRKWHSLWCWSAWRACFSDICHSFATISDSNATICCWSRSISRRVGDNFAQYANLSQELVTRLNAIPGVSSATFSEMSPMEGPGAGAIAVAEDHPEKQPEVSINNISPDYFKTYGTPFLAGRDFSPRDQSGSRVAIINETAARDCFGDENPIGKRITLNHITMTKEEKTFEVIGVVADAKYNHLEQPAPPTVYGNLVSGRRTRLSLSTGDPHKTRSGSHRCHSSSNRRRCVQERSDRAHDRNE